MDISPLKLPHKLFIFFRNKLTIIWYILLTATLIPFFASDITWKPITEMQPEDDQFAFLTMATISVLFFLLLLKMYSNKLQYLKRVQIAWGKARADENTLAYVRGLSKAYRLRGEYVVNGKVYSMLTGLVKEADFEKEYTFPVIYDPKCPEKGKMLMEEKGFIVNALAKANGLEFGG